MSLETVVLIPAYKPTADFPDFIRTLSHSDMGPIVIVNDGSGAGFEAAFESIRELPGVTVLSHPGNRGKGAALKTGMAFIARTYPGAVGVVTADADGQHLVADIRKVATTLLAYPTALVLGVRAFDRAVPWRSKFGNTLTRHMFCLVTGAKITDTQTGLRGIPAELLPVLLKLPANRYEYELDMLLFCKATQRRIVEVLIETVYIAGNQSSHFKPVKDSLRIYLALLRPALGSLLFAGLDVLLFMLAFALTANLAASQALARTGSLGLASLVWKQRRLHPGYSGASAFSRHLVTGVLAGCVSYLGITLLTTQAGMLLLPAKISAEMLAGAAFCFLRRRVFPRPPAIQAHHI